MRGRAAALTGSVHRGQRAGQRHASVSFVLKESWQRQKGAIVPEVTGSPRWPGSLREIRWLCRGAGGGVWRAPWYGVASACFALTAWCRGRWGRGPESVWVWTSPPRLLSRNHPPREVGSTWLSGPGPCGREWTLGPHRSARTLVLPLPGSPLPASADSGQMASWHPSGSL